MRAPCSLRLAIRCSSRSLLATIFSSAKPGGVEDLARLDAEVGEVAGVEADPDRLGARARAGAARPPRRGARPRACRRCRRGTRSCWAAPAPRPRRPRSSPSNAITQLWACVPRTGSPSSRPASTLEVAAQPPTYAAREAREAAVDALGAPQAEVDHLVAARGEHHARRLGRDQRLEVDEVEQRRLDELRLQQRAPHAHERLVGEHHRPLGHRVHVAARGAARTSSRRKRRVEERPAVVARRGRRGRRGPRSPKRKSGEQSRTRARPQATAKPPPNGFRRKKRWNTASVSALPGAPVGLGHRELVEVGESASGSRYTSARRLIGAIMRQERARRRVAEPC